MTNDAMRQIMGFFSAVPVEGDNKRKVWRGDDRASPKNGEKAWKKGVEENRGNNVVQLFETSFRNAINLRRNWDPSVTVAITVCSRISIDYRCPLYLSLLLNTNAQKGGKG